MAVAGDLMMRAESGGSTRTYLAGCVLGEELLGRVSQSSFLEFVVSIPFVHRQIFNITLPFWRRGKK